ncbi:ribosomal-processing cysteine protease Prp [Isachenkonia alkalipeptolytica]|uniref:Ribosomal processing cysteine protease Prp n=1 Tax=Isachenkonia alkalipeptolytica TaxID=2565777 RepID=A0AA43XME9_9CLOT|nr:ribosomal-processing cysteine protease Prp [Isachenkonia alkalipeptolytica]NBG88944.1 ribosomal-processing cysteine protease Prp [Isachenkonia alkalipeptolytica]
MVKVKIKKNNERIYYFEITGHANAAKYGEDIVCSAISVLGQTCIIGLIEVANIDINYRIETGFLTCEIPSNLSATKAREVDIIVNTMYLGMKSVQHSYSEFMEINELEV